MPELQLNELRKIWSEAWRLEPHARIGRSMLEKSLLFKTKNNLTEEQQEKLDQLVRKYKHRPKSFNSEYSALKPGTCLIRNWKGKKHGVLVKTDGFDYQGEHYTSLSQIANNITGSRWNGYLFFGLKKAS